MIRTLIAGLAGAIAMFLWASFAHMATPLGHMGVEEMPNEAPALSALAASLGEEHAFYFYPGVGLGHHPSMEEMKAAMPAYLEKLKTNPWGIVIYHPPGSGGDTMMKNMIVEFGLELVAAVIAAFLLAGAAVSGFLNRVGFVAAIGAISAVATNGSYWNWYGFPTDYTLAHMAIQFVGFIAAGIPIALLAPRS